MATITRAKAKQLAKENENIVFSVTYKQGARSYSLVFEDFDSAMKERAKRGTMLQLCEVYNNGCDIRTLADIK